MSYQILYSSVFLPFSLTLYFPEYNWTFKHAIYQTFKKGTIKCPYEPRTYGVGYLGEGKYKTRENGKKQMNILYGVVY